MVDNTYVKGSAPITEPGTSYIGQVHGIGDRNWTANGLRFACRTCASSYLADLFIRWYGIDDTRVIPCDEPPNRECPGHGG